MSREPVDDAAVPEPRPGAGAGAGPEARPAAGEASTDPPFDEETADFAAAAALARARQAARDKGLRPGSKPLPSARGRRRSPAARDAKDYRDPSLLGDQMDRLLIDRGWNVDVAVGSVMGRWQAIVGADVAAHCSPMTFADGILTVRADSTAWATQMRLLASSILGRLETEVGPGTVTELKVLGPTAPSWSRGLRRAQGPGPRDTYG